MCLIFRIRSVCAQNQWKKRKKRKKTHMCTCGIDTGLRTANACSVNMSQLFLTPVYFCHLADLPRTAKGWFQRAENTVQYQVCSLHLAKMRCSQSFVMRPRCVYLIYFVFLAKSIVNFFCVVHSSETVKLYMYVCECVVDL